MKLRLTAVLRLVLPAVVLAAAALSFRGIDVRGALASARGLSHTVVLVGLGVSLLQAGVLATRLWAVFPAHARPTWTTVARAFGFGQFVNMYLPGRAGDVVKVVMLGGPQGGSSHAKAAGVMLADKGIDILTLVALAAALGPALAADALSRAAGALWVLPLAVLAVVAGLFAIRAWLPNAFQKIRHGASATLHAGRSLLTPARLGATLALGFGAWLAELVLMMIVSSALGAHVTFAQSVVALLVLNLGVAVPVSVANVGAYEAASVAGLAPFGVGTSQALAIGTIHHALQIVTVIVVAAGFWLHDRASRRRAKAPGGRETGLVA